MAPLELPLRPLCPACDGAAVRVIVEATVTFDVVGCLVPGADRDLEVIAHEWHDTAWDGDSPAECGACAWRGTVGELQGA
jgi:hypothetical protein